MLFILQSCSTPVGLEPVSGLDTEVLVPPSNFADGQVQAVFLVVLDKMDMDNLSDHFIAYSDPMLPCVSACDSLHKLFIQLEPGGYLVIPVGLTVAPQLLFTSLDSLLALPQLPIRLPGSNDLEILSASHSILIKERQIATLPVSPWRIDL